MAVDVAPIRTDPARAPVYPEKGWYREKLEEYLGKPRDATQRITDEQLNRVVNGAPKKTVHIGASYVDHPERTQVGPRQYNIGTHRAHVADLTKYVTPTDEIKVRKGTDRVVAFVVKIDPKILDDPNLPYDARQELERILKRGYYRKEDGTKVVHGGEKARVDFRHEDGTYSMTGGSRVPEWDETERMKIHREQPLPRIISQDYKKNDESSEVLDSRYKALSGHSYDEIKDRVAELISKGRGVEEAYMEAMGKKKEEWVVPKRTEEKFVYRTPEQIEGEINALRKIGESVRSRRKNETDRTINEKARLYADQRGIPLPDAKKIYLKELADIMNDPVIKFHERLSTPRYLRGEKEEDKYVIEKSIARHRAKKIKRELGARIRDVRKRVQDLGNIEIIN